MAWRYNPRFADKNSKYGAKKAVIQNSDGSVTKFDSKKEAKRFIELRFLEQSGAIKDLERQVKFELIPAQREADTIGARGGVKKGRVIERECSYVADFVYIDTETGEKIIEDAKGFRTEVYKIKKKLMLWVHGIQIREV